MKAPARRGGAQLPLCAMLAARRRCDGGALLQLLPEQLSTPTEVVACPRPRTSSTACRNPEWLANARKPLDSTTSY